MDEEGLEGVADDQGVLEAAMRKEAKEKEEHLQSELKSFRDYIVMFVLFANLLLGLVVVVFDRTGEATMWSLFYAGTFSLSVRILFSFIYLLEKPYKGACNALIYAIEWLARLTCRCCCCLPRTCRAWMRSTCVLPECCQEWCSWSLLCPWRGNRRKVLLNARRQLSRNSSEEFAFELNQDNNWEARSAVKEAAAGRPRRSRRTSASRSLVLSSTSRLNGSESQTGSQVCSSRRNSQAQAQTTDQAAQAEHGFVVRGGGRAQPPSGGASQHSAKGSTVRKAGTTV